MGQIFQTHPMFKGKARPFAGRHHIIFAKLLP
jgi:hypothetical protein